MPSQTSEVALEACIELHLTGFDELLGIPKDLGDYVIVHELLHLAVPNHGKLWRSLMRAHLGEYEIAEKRLPKLEI